VLVRTAPKSVNSAQCVALLNVNPTGCCIHAFRGEDEKG
jgi:hypothetical protein